jgi:hypothetical protein
MATQPALSTIANYSEVSEFYLALWKQLEIASGGAKWLDIRPENPSDLNEEVQRRLRDLGPGLSESDLNTARKDFEKAQNLVASGTVGDMGELVSFREYLRDLALRYSELADEDSD